MLKILFKRFSFKRKVCHSRLFVTSSLPDVVQLAHRCHKLGFNLKSRLITAHRVDRELVCDPDMTHSNERSRRTEQLP